MSRLRGKLFLVTGGAGFIGSHVVEQLLTSGAKVRVLDNLSSGSRENLAEVFDKIELIVGDITDSTTVKQAVQGVEGIFHLAAKTSAPGSIESPVEYHTTNVLGSLHVIEAARFQKTPLVFSSSAAVYGDTETIPVGEKTECEPLSPYGLQKLEVEGYLRLFAEEIPSYCLRYFNVYGPRQDPSSSYSGVISRFCEAISEGRDITIYGNGEQTRDFIFVEDVARANLLAMDGAVAGARQLNVGTGTEISLNHLATLLMNLCRRDVAIKQEPARKGDIFRSASNSTAAKTEIGFSAQTDFAGGLQKTLASLRLKAQL